MLTVRHPQRRHFLLAACHTDYHPRPTPLSIVVPSAGNFSRKWRMDHSCHWFTAINLRHRDHSAVMSATVVTAVSRQIDCPASPLLLWPELPPVRTWSFPASTVRGQFRPTGDPFASTVVTNSTDRDPHWPGYPMTVDVVAGVPDLSYWIPASHRNHWCSLLSRQLCHATVYRSQPPAGLRVPPISGTYSRLPLSPTMNLFLALFWPPPATILVVIVMEVLAVLPPIDSDSCSCWRDHLGQLVGVPDRPDHLDADTA